MAATHDDIVNMLRSEKHRSRKHRTFAMAGRRFDGDSAEMDVHYNERGKDETASLKLLDDFVW